MYDKMNSVVNYTSREKSI